MFFDNLFHIDLDFFNLRTKFELFCLKFIPYFRSSAHPHGVNEQNIYSGGFYGACFFTVHASFTKKLQPSSSNHIKASLYQRCVTTCHHECSVSLSEVGFNTFNVVCAGVVETSSLMQQQECD